MYGFSLFLLYIILPRLLLLFPIAAWMGVYAFSHGVSIITFCAFSFIFLFPVLCIINPRFFLHCMSHNTRAEGQGMKNKGNVGGFRIVIFLVTMIISFLLVFFRDNLTSIPFPLTIFFIVLYISLCIFCSLPWIPWLRESWNGREGLMLCLNYWDREWKKYFYLNKKYNILRNIIFLLCIMLYIVSTSLFYYYTMMEKWEVGMIFFVGIFGILAFFVHWFGCSFSPQHPWNTKYWYRSLLTIGLGIPLLHGFMVWIYLPLLQPLLRASAPYLFLSIHGSSLSVHDFILILFLAIITSPIQVSIRFLEEMIRIMEKRVLM